MVNQTSSEGHYIYVFSSGFRDLYRQNILDNLASPVGYIVHYRYEEQHVHDAVWKLAASQPKLLAGCHGLVSFVDQVVETDRTTGKDKVVVKGLYPLRTIEIKEIRLDGPVLHVYFALGGYITYGQDSGGNQASYETMLGESLDSNSRPPTKYIALTSQVTKIPSAQPDPNSQAQAWTSLVKELDELEPFRRSVFYRVIRLSLITAPPRTAGILAYIRRAWQRRQLTAHPLEEALIEVLPLRSGYRLQSGRFYSLELSFYRETGAERVHGARLLARLNPAHFAYDPGAIEVKFRYDNYAVDLIPTPQTRDAFTRIQIELDKDKENESREATQQPAAPINAPQPIFVMQVVAPRRQYLGFVIFLIGSVMTSVSSTLVDPLKTIFSVSGPAITTGVLFWLYRNLK